MKLRSVKPPFPFLLSPLRGLLLAALVAGCTTSPPANQADKSKSGASDTVAADTRPVGAETTPTAPARDERTTARALVTERDLGIKATTLRVARSGATLELRFYLDEPRRGVGLFDRDTPPFLLDERTGATLTTAAPPIPYGAGRSSSAGRLPKRRSYLIQFSNARRTAKSGARLSLVVDKVKLTGLVVE